MAYIGTAIGVGCVTGAANRMSVPFLSRELSRWQASMVLYLPTWYAMVIVLSRYKQLVYR